MHDNKILTERIRKLGEFDSYLDELADECREAKGHLASIRSGEMIGVRWARDEIRPLIDALSASVPKLEQIVHDYGTERANALANVMLVQQVLQELERVVTELEAKK